MAVGFKPDTNSSQFQDDLSNISSDTQNTSQGTEEEQAQYARQMAAQKNKERRERRGSNIVSKLKHISEEKGKKFAWQLTKRVGKSFFKRFILLNPWFWIIAACLFLLLGMFAIFLMSTAVACNRPQDLAGGGWKGELIVGFARFTSNYLGGAVVSYYVQENVCQYFTDSGTPATATNTEQENVSGAVDGDAAARAYLAQFGIRVNATEPQTSLEGILQSTLEEVVRVQSMCEQWAMATGRARDPVSSAIGVPLAGAYCDIVVTGGTEQGHATRGRCIHGSGFKIDLRHTPNLNAYIETHFTPTAPRGSDPSWQNNATNANYVREDDHWDTSVGCA